MDYCQACSSFWLASQKKSPCFTNLIDFLFNYFSVRPLTIATALPQMPSRKMGVNGG
jgi:hypothetical protein